MVIELIKDQPLILVVDDMSENLKVIGSILKEERYRIIVATDGLKAFELATTQNPDLVLLDIQMPGIDGYDVCKRLKNNQSTSAIPVIFLSAYNEPAYISRGFDAGGDDYITKPFQAKEIIARIQTHLSLKFSLQKLNELNISSSPSEVNITPVLKNPGAGKSGFASWFIKTFVNKNRRIFTIIFISLIFIVIVLWVLDIYIYPDSRYQGYLQGIFTNIIGMIIFILMVEIILAENRKKEQKENEKKGLLRSTNVLNIYLKEYSEAAYYLATPHFDTKRGMDFKIQKGFPFQNLSDLFSQNPFLFDTLGKTKAEAYFERLDNLKDSVKTILYQVDLTNFPVLLNLFEKYLQYVESFNPKNAILGDLRSIMGKQNTSEFIKEIIEKHNGPVNYFTSNIINKYIRLFELINFHIDFENKYLSNIVFLREIKNQLSK